MSSKVLESFIDLSQENDLPQLIDVEDSDDEEDGVVVPPVVAPNVGDSVFKALDSVLGPSTVVFSNIQPSRRTRTSREYNTRPDNWAEIADYYQHHRHVAGTIFHFKLKSEDVNKNERYWTTMFGRWMNDVADKKWSLIKGQLPVYGTKIDKELVLIVENYNAHAVPMTNMMLRLHLLTLLKDHDRQDILDAIAATGEPLSRNKKYRFTDQWAMRFYKRNDLCTRVATTKMREELPAQYEEKVERFKYILSLNIHDHQVPDALILNMDETNTMFVPQIPRTRCKKGTRRVRLVGVGKDKAQVTTSPTVNAEGDVVSPTQIIFGGKTKRCHPNGGKGPVPKDIYYDNSLSHWQTPETMIRYINRVLVPYRLATIARLNLPIHQKMILILDLHYSHKDAVVLALAREYHILLVYIPAGCTDLHQVCDVVVNKPYKNGVVKSFIDYVTEKFGEFNQRVNPNPADVFQLNMAGSVMKPLIPGYVERGMEAVGQLRMKDVIKACFYKASFVGEARQLETYELAKLKYQPR